ncbi:helix-turn-helix transcriptional regulator [Rhizobium skierniewicense]|uniref:ArsR/SmtB family transcription factor n=1 Tax=Rhizobium TaxID=379 RepID=UPI001FAC393E|nr:MULTISPECIES: metalloregulator ArsR/SmtB family transcription factor [Rhizobium]MCI9868436.1 helix-turn-helix transcriptional regulator [Rhizobium skierniewicense]
MDKFDSAEKKWIPLFDFEKAANLLLMLSNEMRIEILRRLIDREWNVNALSDAIGLTQSATSQHLAKMRNMNLVSTRKAAQQIFYSCNSDDVRQILTVIADLDLRKNMIEASEVGRRRSSH